MNDIKVHIYNTAHKLLNLHHICEKENMDQQNSSTLERCSLVKCAL